MENSREAILDAAQAVFTQKGFDGASVALIAKEAGVSKATLYHYFESKHEILAKVMERVFTNLIEFLANSNIKTISNRQELIVLLNRHFDFIASQKELLSIAISEALKTDTKDKNIIFELPERMLKRFPSDLAEETRLIVGFLSIAYVFFTCIDAKVDLKVFKIGDNLGSAEIETIIRRELIQMLVNKFELPTV